MMRSAWRLTLWRVLILLLTQAPMAHAGVLAGATRVIFQGGQRERSLMLANTNPYPVVVQTWVDRGEGDPDGPSMPFIALPSVFRLQPGGIQGLRILYTRDALPQDRESAFWLNLYEIPPATTGEQAELPRVEMAMNTQLKIFYRPAGLAAQGDALAVAPTAQSLRFCLRRQADEWQLVGRNESPYHVSFAALAVAGRGTTWPARQEPDMMMAPFSERAYLLDTSPLSTDGGVQYAYVDDGGFPVAGTAPLDQCTVAGPAVESPAA
uniref:fimbrial biogenesis chaperone n=1 Tax=Castellaniella defragrans TaxID=75697 RepID=UPI0033421757